MSIRVLPESPDLQWFGRESYKCRQCGKPAQGRLYSRRNEDYGMHCEKCAAKRLAAAKRVREELAREDAQPASGGSKRRVG